MTENQGNFIIRILMFISYVLAHEYLGGFGVIAKKYKQLESDYDNRQVF